MNYIKQSRYTVNMVGYANKANEDWLSYSRELR
jgi:hypothetical protein